MKSMENWKDIEGYEGLYQISDLGRVKSLERKVKHSRGGLQIVKERILKHVIKISNYRSYYRVVLSKNGNHKTVKIHRLVALAFIDNPENKMQVNHVDNNPLNNCASNLEWMTNRENVTHGYTFKETTSPYPGVSWDSRANKWQAGIGINGKKKRIGSFTCEHEAAQAYQTALSNT